MEQLIQRYVRYFYIALIGGISMQLLDAVLSTLKEGMNGNIFILVFLSIINLILLISNMRHNIKQRFIECKVNAKMLRFTMAILLAFHAILCFLENFDGIMLGNHFMTIILIEVILDYRIKSIEYLEKLADQYAKDQQKGE